MQVTNRVTSNARQVKEFLEAGHDGPVYMLSSAAYQNIVVHRNTGLAGQFNIETVDPVGAWLMP